MENGYDSNWTSTVTCNLIIDNDLKLDNRLQVIDKHLLPYDVHKILN